MNFKEITDLDNADLIENNFKKTNLKDFIEIL